MNYRVNCDIQISVEERSDRFAARTNVSGMTVYGATESEATEKVHEAIKFLFSTIVKQMVKTHWLST